jgi:L-lactate dehydrogenase complex protein LldF
VYRRSGGHSYHATIPGPIGSVLGPLRDAKQHYSLPYACSLCGSCGDVCPVKIPLPEQLLTWRGEIVKRGLLPWPKRLAMKLGRVVLGHTWLYNLSGKMARFFIPILPRWMLYHRLNDWGKQRELPPFPKQSFRELYQEKHGPHK